MPTDQRPRDQYRGGQEETYRLAHGSLAEIFGQREEFYRAVLDNLAEGVLITDKESRIVYASARMREMSGYDPAELLGRVSYEVLSPKKNWGNMKRRLALRLSGKEENYEHELITKDGRTTWVSVKATPYRDGRGNILGTVGALSCIDRQKFLEQENEYLRTEFQGTGGLDGLIGPSAALARIRDQIGMVAGTDATVLICGESGTGKELVAGAVQSLSERKSKPFIRVNCAAIPKELFESEFFGHVRGSFTGATRDRIGRFELADGGTLFLDEVGEIPLDLQGKLLRVIQERQFERIGDDRTRTVNVRLISATNRDLEQESASGRFRLDLYYRLSVFPIEVPPLRERPEDIVPLAQHILGLASRTARIRTPELSRAQAKALEQYSWPGNARELQNVIERAVILAIHGEFAIQLDKGPRKASSRPVAVPLDRTALRAVKDQEKDLIVEAMRTARGKIYGPDGAASLLGLKPTTLASKLAKLGIKRGDFAGVPIHSGAGIVS